jgi:hypothetical protein
MVWHNFIDVSLKFYCYYGIYYKIDHKNKNFSLDRGVLKGMGVDKIEVY